MGIVVETKRTKQEYEEGKLTTTYTETTRYISDEPPAPLEKPTPLEKIVFLAGALVPILEFLNKLWSGLLG